MAFNDCGDHAFTGAYPAHACRGLLTLPCLASFLSPQVPYSSGTAQGQGQFKQSALLEQPSPLCSSAGHPLPLTPLTRHHRRTTADGHAFNSSALMLSWAIPSPLPSHHYNGPIDHDRGVHPPPPLSPLPPPFVSRTVVTSWVLTSTYTNVNGAMGSNTTLRHDGDRTQRLGSDVNI